MKIPWFNKKKSNQGERKTDKKDSAADKSVLKINNKIYSQELLSNEVKELIRQIKRSEEVIKHQKNKIELLKNAQRNVIEDLRKSILEKS